MSGKLQAPPQHELDVDAELLARFERRCRREGRDPREVLEALLAANLPPLTR